MSDDATNSAICRGDYRPPPYTIAHIELDFELDEQETLVKAVSDVRRTEHAAEDAALVLDGEGMALVSVAIDGRPLAAHEYTLDDRALTIARVPERFQLEVVSRLSPADNHALEGLYVTEGIFCTQCEPESFRRITWFTDRPDVMARYRVTLRADASRYPVLLSNGNRVDAGELPGGRHYVTWDDPHPKPSYLFAAVAGDLACRKRTHRTRSGREVSLEAYVSATDLDETDHCLDALERVMEWDERAFGRECDLETYMLVGVRDLNMGAMENKGLNIFGKEHLLAHIDTTTDEDFALVESAVAHEYLHNWSGNRVTCRDWFQLSLKEGLTIFRDQEYSADAGSRALARIEAVKFLHASQFPEDASASAHPVRPETYHEVANFYTMTIYYKGAELVRMMQTLVGPERFRRGIDLYFERHDGQAVTCEELVRAIEDASQYDLGQFRRWYEQPGTPTLRVEGHHDPDTRTYTLQCEQTIASRCGKLDEAPLTIPIRAALLGPDGHDMLTRLDDGSAPATEHVLELREPRQRFVFHDVSQPPTPSLLRGFSAPVRLDYEASDAELRHRVAHDGDAVNRWSASQTLMRRRVLAAADALRTGHAPAAIDEPMVQTLHATLQDDFDPALLAQVLELPSELALGDGLQDLDPQLLWRAREHLRGELGRTLRADWERHYAELAQVPSEDRGARAMGCRGLRNLCLDYLTAADETGEGELAWQQLLSARNMTEELGALRILCDLDGPVREHALERFYARYSKHALVVDKWFAVQASARSPELPGRIRSLAQRKDFDLANPGRVRSLFNTFSYFNPVGFHAPDGTGYEVIGEYVLRTDRLNPQLAAMMVLPLSRYQHYVRPLRDRMLRVLRELSSEATLSSDVREQVDGALAGTDAA